MIQIPSTEGIKYAGSKLKILPYILEQVSGLSDVHSVLDGFSGTTRVSQAFHKLGYDLVTNDRAVWSEVFARCFLQASQPKVYYQEIIDYLNALPGKEGWYTRHYGGTNNDGQKHPFQRKNTLKLDAIREEIDRMNLSEVDKSVVLTSLILALDHVDSTLGHYASYLAEWSPRSYQDMLLKVPDFDTPEILQQKFGRIPEVQVYRDDIFQVLPKQEVDLAYFDPPYGSNNEKMPSSRVRYFSYYHLWTTLVLNDHPKTFGRCGRREDSRDTLSSTPFEEYRKDASGSHIAMKAIDRLIQETKAHYILLSYSSGGRATKQELLDIVNTRGKLLKVVEIDYKKHVMAAMKWTNEWASEEKKNLEYLFLLEK